MDNIPAYNPSDFVCQNCDMSLPQSPTWEEFCIYCTMMFLESDMQLNKAVHQATVEKVWNAK